MNVRKFIKESIQWFIARILSSTRSNSVLKKSTNYGE